MYNIIMLYVVPNQLYTTTIYIFPFYFDRKQNPRHLLKTAAVTSACLPANDVKDGRRAFVFYKLFSAK